MLPTDSVPYLESPSQDTFSIPGHSIFVKGLVFLHPVRLPCFHPGFRCRASAPGNFHTFLLNPCSPLGVHGLRSFYSQAQAQHRLILCTGLGL